jgi:hypothetical protein
LRFIAQVSVLLEREAWLTLELTGRARNAETIQVDDKRQANSRSG